jgi:hypothetical protein
VPSVPRSFALTADVSLLIDAFCCLAEFASPLERMRKQIGAVGIENNTERNFKDLERMLGNAKATTQRAPRDPVLIQLL